MRRTAITTAWLPALPQATFVAFSQLLQGQFEEEWHMGLPLMRKAFTHAEVGAAHARVAICSQAPGLPTACSVQQAPAQGRTDY